MNRAAVVLAASVLLAGCGNGAGLDSSELVETPSAAGKAATVPALPRWQDVPPEPVVGDFRTGTQPFPGIAIGQHQPDTKTTGCTAGPLVRKIADGAWGFVTAGHCDRSSGQRVYIFASAAEPLEVGVYSEKRDNDADQDSALLETVLAPTPDAARIAGRFPVDRVMEVEEAMRLEPGTPICLDGARTGITCTPLVRTDWDTIKFEIATVDGDSGAPVFVVGGDGRAVLIGILKGKDGATGLDEATYLDPALDRLAAEIVTA